MQKTYWDKLGKNYQFYTTATLEMIAGFCLSKDVDGIFEASCGTGYFVKLLRDMGYKWGYVGSDYCDCFVEWAGQNNPNEEFHKNINLLKELPYPNEHFDISVVHHGMDYVYPYRTALTELKRVSSKYVVITLWQQFSDGNRIGFTEKNGWNVNIYDKQEWYDEIKEAGYSIHTDAEIMEYNEKYDKMVYNHLFILKV